MPIETVESVLDQLDRPIRICYIGGEPCLWLARYPHVLGRTLDDGHAMHMISNGLLLRKIPGLVDAFRDRQISIQISIDGVAETYESIRKRASWQVLVDNIRALVRARMDGGNDRAVISANYLLMRRTLPDLPRFVEFCAAEGIDVVLLTYTMIFDRMVRLGEISEDESVYHCREETQAAIEKARDVARREGISLTAPPPIGDSSGTGPQWTGTPISSPFPGNGSILPQSGPILCNKPWTEVWVYEDGRVVPCCCGNFGPTVGSIQSGLEAVWNGEQIGEIRSKLAAGEFPKNCRCGINISAVGRKMGEEHFFSRVRDEKRRTELTLSRA
jgi:MoaA/NifB/PqqE/SkfB family radical SAM enzyme